ncbi:MAG: pyrroline-5-carboxylate reductase [Verrucomicrobiae bacterium]|jgi:pyrroline-5-carboxylate reductase|nr:pyrroline-5-carboxylate reductase [Verrucomicrobiae bacterium]
MGERLSIGFLGAGKMATALGKGFLKAGLVDAADLIASDVFEAARSSFASETGGTATSNNLEVLQRANIILLAVKPGQIESVLTGIRDTATKGHLFISIAAGVPIAKMESCLPTSARLIRVMPNTPALVGASATAYALGSHASQSDGDLAGRLFSALGTAYPVPENLLDAVTGLSGSGPAYVYMIIEALSDGGVAAGLPRDIATKLAAQTLLGGARMVLETGIHPGQLKDMVTSPGGTTIEGVHALERGGLRATLMNAVRAAAEKSRKLGQD